jgi:5-methylcytosine-specific restriction protein A
MFNKPTLVTIKTKDKKLPCPGLLDYMRNIMDHKPTEFTFQPKESISPFYAWKYGSYKASFQWEDAERAELMCFSPSLITSWNTKHVFYEFVLIMTKAKNARPCDVWFWRLRNPVEVLDIEYDSSGFSAPWVSHMLYYNGIENTGVLSLDAAPGSACKHFGTILEAGRGLRFNGFDYLFSWGYEPTRFNFFSAKCDHLGLPPAPNKDALWQSVCKLFAPSKTQQNQNKRKTPVRLRRKILERDGYKCVDCGRSPRNDPSCVLHVDHRIAVACGGSDHPSNLQTLCDWCNLGKKTDPDWKFGIER